jgi:hypothetical protein
VLRTLTVHVSIRRITITIAVGDDTLVIEIPLTALAAAFPV